MGTFLDGIDQETTSPEQKEDDHPQDGKTSGRSSSLELLKATKLDPGIRQKENQEAFKELAVKEDFRPRSNGKKTDGRTTRKTFRTEVSAFRVTQSCIDFINEIIESEGIIKAEILERALLAYSRELGEEWVEKYERTGVSGRKRS